MKHDEPARDAGFYRDVSKITLEGLARITREFEMFYDELAQKFQPALENMAQHNLPEASDQLKTIIEATEEATSDIMDVLENMQVEQGKVRLILEQLRGDESISKPTGNLLAPASDSLSFCENGIMNIFELLSFQDLTGQRIKRIVTLVQSVEEQVRGILGALGQKVPDKGSPADASPEGTDLLKGPQKPGQGLDQLAIDNLLADL